MPKLSVVIPVYNAQKYIRECLDSVLGQSLQDIEVICVDDGSTDDSLHILEEYAAREERLTVLCQQNQYAGAARNKGLSIAKGEYVHFLDADDYVVNYAYESLYRRASEYQLDCLKCRSVAFDMRQNTTVDNPTYLFSGLRPEDYNHLLNAEEDGPLYHISVVPWNGIYRRAFLEEHQIRFNSLFCINDRSFYWRVITNAKRMMISRDRLTVHRVGQSESLVGRRAQHFDCQFRSLQITAEQMISDKITDSMALLVMQRELMDLRTWYRRFCHDPQYGAKIQGQTRRFVEEYDGLYPELLRATYQNYMQSVPEGIKAYTQFPERKIFREECRNPKVSIIIPVYNVQEYLHQCLDSVMEQTLEDIEIICVDDGSADASKIILKEYEALDQRFHVICQQNAYAGAARNRGLLEAKGSYLLFLDADDFFDPSLCEKAFRKAGEADADIVLFGGKEYDTCEATYTDKPNFLRKEMLPNPEVFSRKDIPNEILMLTPPNPWLKIFRRNFILKEGIRFQEIRHSNDIFFSIVTLAAAGRIACVKEDLVYYRTGRRFSLQDTKDSSPTLFLDAYEAAYEELVRREIYREVEKSFADRMIASCLHNINTVKTEKAWRDIVQKLWSPSVEKMGIFNHSIEYYRFPNKVQSLLACKSILQWLKSFEQKRQELSHMAGEFWRGQKDYLLLSGEEKSIFYVYEYYYCYMEMERACYSENAQAICKSAGYERLKSVLYQIRTAYMHLPVEERRKADVFPPEKKDFFAWDILEPCNTRMRLQRKCSQQEKRIKELVNSKDYKLGKKLLWLPRKIKKWCRFFLDVK